VLCNILTAMCFKWIIFPSHFSWPIALLVHINTHTHKHTNTHTHTRTRTHM
jgi:hypothetical protein